MSSAENLENIVLKTRIAFHTCYSVLYKLGKKIKTCYIYLNSAAYNFISDKNSNRYIWNNWLNKQI